MKRDKATKDLLEFFSIFPWPDDPESKDGKKYFAKTLKFMEKLVDHPCIRELLKKKEVKILEICGGAGFGGIALAKLLLERNIDVEILITDLREDVLKKAENWGKQIKIEKIKTMTMDAKEIHNIKDNFDVVLLYGLSTPHFDPWELVKVFSSVSWVLKDKGIFVVDETDRRHGIFLTTGYKWALAEGDENKLSVSFHTGYNLRKGTIKRTYLNFVASVKPLTMEIFMWGLAEVGALIWVFFNNVDLIPLGGTRHFIVGYNPRKRIKPSEFKKPALFKEGRND